MTRTWKIWDRWSTEQQQIQKGESDLIAYRAARARDATRSGILDFNADTVSAIPSGVLVHECVPNFVRCITHGGTEAWPMALCGECQDRDTAREIEMYRRLALAGTPFAELLHA